jgi:hypothetical protein
VWEIPSLLAYPIYADDAGRRSFGPPKLQAYEVGSNAVELLADRLPIHVFQTVAERAALNAGCTKRADASGRITYTSVALGLLPSGRPGSPEGTWTTQPPPLKLHLIVWAAGFKPTVLATPAVQARDKLCFSVVLQPLPDCARIAQAASDLENAQQRRAKAIHSQSSIWRRAYMVKLKVEEPLLRELVRDLEQWARDETLPGYLRWNAVDRLRSVAWQVPGEEKALKEEVKAALARAEAGGATLSPYLSNAAPNPWRTLSEAEELLSGLAGRGFGDSVAVRAKTVLAEGEAALPGLPLWDNLRAVVALAEGDRVRAATLARGMDHRQFFGLFYGLDVQAQRISGGLGE